MESKTEMDIVDSSAILRAKNEDQNGNNRQDEHDAKPIVIGHGEIVVARMAAERDAILYNMNHEKRGMAIIFNHKIFDEHTKLKKRDGTDKDCSNLKEVFKMKFDFDVSVCPDYTADKVLKTIKDIASVVDHTKHDCIVICVLSHGDEGFVWAKDASYETKSIWEPFTADKCPTLAGKPKIFFIQACQGDSTDAGVTVKRTEADGGSAKSYKIPNQADFLICYSTVPGYLSWRNTTDGSWYIQALVKELRDNGTKRDLVTLLTFVNQKVAFHCESSKPKDPTLHMKKQIPSFTSRFTRLFVFGTKAIADNK